MGSHSMGSGELIRGFLGESRAGVSRDEGLCSITCDVGLLQRMEVHCQLRCAWGDISIPLIYARG